MKKAQDALKDQKWKEADCGKPDREKPMLRHRVKSPRVPMTAALIQGKDPKDSQAAAEEVQKPHMSASKSRSSKGSEPASKKTKQKDSNASSSSRVKASKVEDGSSANQKEQEAVEVDKQQERKDKKARQEKKEEHKQKDHKDKKEKKDKKDKKDKTKQKQEKKATRDAPDAMLSRKGARENILECFKEFEDSDEEKVPAMPGKRRELKPGTSGPEIDEAEVAEEYLKFKWGENWQQSWLGWQDEEWWQQVGGDQDWGENEAPNNSAQDDQEDQEDHEAAKEKTLEEISPVPEAEEVRSEESKPAARKPMLALPPIPDPSQEDTLVLAVPQGRDKRYIFDEHGILQTPPKYIKKGAEACLFRGSRKTMFRNTAAAAANTPDPTPRTKIGRKVQSKKKKKNRMCQCQSPQSRRTEPTVNSKSHKKEWMKIDRLVASNPDVYPTISKLWNSGAKERNSVLRQFVSVDGVFEKVESQLSWKASVRSTAKSRKALLNGLSSSLFSAGKNQDGSSHA